MARARGTAARRGPTTRRIRMSIWTCTMRIPRRGRMSPRNPLGTAPRQRMEPRKRLVLLVPARAKPPSQPTTANRVLRSPRPRITNRPRRDLQALRLLLLLLHPSSRPRNAKQLCNRAQALRHLPLRPPLPLPAPHRASPHPAQPQPRGVATRQAPAPPLPRPRMSARATRKRTCSASRTAARDPPTA